VLRIVAGGAVAGGCGRHCECAEFRLARPELAAQIAPLVEQAAGQGFSAATWMEENKALFRALKLEKLVTAIFIGLITFVSGAEYSGGSFHVGDGQGARHRGAAFDGARREQIRRIFLLQGLAIGASGTVLGWVFGYAFAWIAGTYQLIPLDPQVYAVPYVPFHPNFLDGLWIASAAMSIAIVATLLPARGGGPVVAVEILRFE